MQSTSERFVETLLHVAFNSLRRFVETELMTGENRWRAGEHGLQDARRGVRFLLLPAVLQVKQAFKVLVQFLTSAVEQGAFTWR